MENLLLSAAIFIPKNKKNDDKIKKYWFFLGIYLFYS